MPRMNTLSRFTCTLLIILVCPMHTQAQELVLGRYKKNVWNESLTDALNGELVKVLYRKDDLFEKLSPEVELELNPYFDVNSRFSRSVREHLPRPAGEKLSPYDFASYKVANEFQIDFEAKANAGPLFTYGQLGTRLVHMSNHVPSINNKKCDFFHQILDDSVDEGKAFIKAHCSGSRDKQSSLYLRTVNKISSLLASILNYFADSEKNKLYGEDPLSPLKIHSLLGLPLNPEIFRADNNTIQKGDVVEHVTFFGWRPLGIEFNVFEFFKPNSFLYKRTFRSVRFQKLPNNFVDVEIEDTQISGNSTEIFNLRPKIGIIKLNFGRFATQNFYQESLIQKFKVDISKAAGTDFFRHLVKQMYKPSFKDLESALVTAPNDDAIENEPPIYRNGNGEETRLQIKLPGIFKYESRNYKDVEDRISHDDFYLKAERLQSEYLYSKFNFSLGPFRVLKKKHNQECTINFNINRRETGLEGSTLNFGCKYSNTYANNIDKDKALESLIIGLNGYVKDEDIDKISSLNLNREPFTLYNQVFFSQPQIENIFNATEEQVTAEISKMMFGEDAKNIFSPKYKNIWRGYKRLRSTTVASNSRFFKQCSEMLYHYGITDSIEEKYDNFEGIAGHLKGLYPFNKYACESYYHSAKELTTLITSLQENGDRVENANQILELFDNTKHIGLAQNLLVRLAGGLSAKGVKYTYLANSPQLEEPIFHTEGSAQMFAVHPAQDISNELIAQNFHRVSKITYLLNENDRTKIKVNLLLQYEIEDLAKTSVNVILSDYKLSSAENLKEFNLTFDQMSQVGEKEFEFYIPVASDFNFEIGHNAFLRLIGHDNQAIGRETRSYLNSVNNSAAAGQ